VIDNPFRATDLAYVSTAVPGGPAQARFSTSPDNEASRIAFGGMLKFAGQTRLLADMAFNTWTQDAAFLPYTINSAIFSPAGAPANSVATLQQKSLAGKYETTSVMLTFSSRPVRGLGIRARYRLYDQQNKTNMWVITGDVAGSPDRSWSVVTPTADAPFGHATANPYSNKTSRFEGQVSYDFGDLTIEGGVRAASLERTSREATSGDENAWSLAAIYRTSDWLSFRAFYDDAERTAEGQTIYGFQADEAERETTKAGFNVELTPLSKVGFGFSYFRRNDDYTNRPDRIAVSGGVPVAGALPIPGTPSGLLEASYDTYTVDVDFTPNERAEISAYYTYEKNASTNQWSTTTAATATPPLSLNNLLNYAGSDRGDTFGANAKFDLVPEKWTMSFMAQSQKIDGLMDITAREAGSFYTPGRTTLIPAGQGGAADILDYDDTRLTTIVAELAYAVAKAWTLSVGYAYEEYSHADAFSDGTSIFPQSVLFFMKGNDGGYKVNLGYAKLNYRF
ncbi:MAG TPA: MtrB/PioB family outer membrane beta-barrel protein, partial [Vicinamibacterales bacterium]|nr:MtrB/PioB family outer membrane beta-barrel protein [Vicinamibacterales bacterium]